MARFGGGKKFMRNKKKGLYAQVKGRKNARRKPLLPKRGVNQTSYEAGFFDFLKVFWNSNRGMNIYDLTKQVASVWDALLPKPKFSRKRVLKDYSKEYEAIQHEKQRIAQQELIDLNEEKLREEETRRDRHRRQEKHTQSEEKESESETAGSSRSNFEEDSGSDVRDSRSRSDVENDSETDDEEDSISGRDSDSEKNLSETQSEESVRRRSRKQKRKRKGRKYRNYEAYLRAKKINPESRQNKEGEQNNADKNSAEEKKESDSSQNKEGEQGEKDEATQDGVFFPVRTETSFDRIVQADLENQTELLKKLKICKPYSDVPYDPDDPDADDICNVGSDDSFGKPLGKPRFPISSQDPKYVIPKSLTPTNTLHVKNLVVGIRQPELQEIFRVFLNDIVLIRVLDSKFRGEAVIEFKSVETAQNAWRQMNGVEFRRLPLVLEFVNKEDLLE